ncbi:endonuclease/exonuclease/phosphatase family protein [Chitinasiproducens palmae]|uniref:Metal-dependent hydrolase, endonuclease/exonuclease/phosphatase family n=1 Tax=Chitinasiproducens palmae TaxID=1770053 RepID=A0A1H2PPH8_9BURK|nr:endonuclease/exonuclease/phosphatase family protein [Chitinasiproducens palmae]SDV48574.1 Metal-dependent hydrolase, endonuclease/exonuclease/phosphatase family [Chitinasiproducens palmae]
MRNPIESGDDELLVVSWNLHKGRSPLGLQAWKAMRSWLAAMPADVFFLQEAMARRMPMPLAAATFGEPSAEPPGDAWHCQATEIAASLQLQLALGQNVFKPSWRHGNAILSPHPLDLGGRWDISAHRFERRGLLAARMTARGRSISLLCAHLALTRAARVRQMEWIARWIERDAPDGPLILAGDFNDWKNDSLPIFGAIGMHEVAAALGASGRTFPAFSPALGLDKMFVRGLSPREWTSSDAKVAWLSDHRPYIARLGVD